MTTSREVPNSQLCPELDDRRLLASELGDWGTVRYLWWRGEPGRARPAWTTERSAEGFFLSFVYRPVGSGTGFRYVLDVPSIRRHRRRKDAKERARRLRQADGADQRSALADLLTS